MASESKSATPQEGDPNADEKPRLTEVEKKQNHIASEQKRREAIRAGFDRLCNMVPGLEGQGRSEGHVLKETVKYMRLQLERRRDVVQDMMAKGEFVSEEAKEPLKILERLEAKDRERAARGELPDDDEI